MMFYECLYGAWECYWREYQIWLAHKPKWWQVRKRKQWKKEKPDWIMEVGLYV